MFDIDIRIFFDGKVMGELTGINASLLYLEKHRGAIAELVNIKPNRRPRNKMEAAIKKVFYGLPLSKYEIKALKQFSKKIEDLYRADRLNKNDAASSIKKEILEGLFILDFSEYVENLPYKERYPNGYLMYLRGRVHDILFNIEWFCCSYRVLEPIGRLFFIINRERGWRDLRRHRLSNSKYKSYTPTDYRSDWYAIARS